MKSLLIALAMSAGLVSAPFVFAADAPAKGNSKMAECNKQSAGKTGDEKKAFMSSCMSAKPAPAKGSKMSECNKQSAGKTGDERKAFMSACMSGKPA